MIRNACLFAAASLVAGMAQATCYSVYKADGTLLQETSTPPVDLTHQIGDTIPLKFGPGATMTISESGFYCANRTEELSTQNSLAAAVRAEEKKAMLVKAPEAKVEAVKAVAVKAPEVKVDAAKVVPVKAEPAKVTPAKEDGSKTVVVKQDGTKTVVETQEGTVLKVKGKAKQQEAK